MQTDLSGKVAIVTGGARDIGRAISLKLARRGATVVVNYLRSADAARETVDYIESEDGNAAAIQADVSTESGVKALIDETGARFGRTIHILVNNAGGIIARKRVSEMDAAFIDTVMDVNVKSTLLMTAATLPHLPEYGCLVNMASLAARHGGGGGSIAYAAAKGAILTMTRGMAKEFADRKIRVNCVSPGLIATRFHDDFSTPEGRAATVAQTPLRREGTADDVANAVAFLASEDASFITGESIEINGGLWFV